MAGKTKKSDAKATREARRSMSLLDQAQHTAHRKARDRRAEGRAARNAVPLASHAEFTPAAGRSDSVALLQGQDKLRIASLVPIRFGRMSASPFSYYRGAAIVMAEDLAGTPTTGWLVQACGDAHVDNFGGFGTDQGSLVFDVNDFDETYPAPWEWDVKRLAASAVLAAREIGAGKAPQRDSCDRGSGRLPRGDAGAGGHGCDGPLDVVVLRARADEIGRRLETRARQDGRESARADELGRVSQADHASSTASASSGSARRSSSGSPTMGSSAPSNMDSRHTGTTCVQTSICCSTGTSSSTSPARSSASAASECPPTSGSI